MLTYHNLCGAESLAVERIARADFRDDVSIGNIVRGGERPERFVLHGVEHLAESVHALETEPLQGVEKLRLDELDALGVGVGLAEGFRHACEGVVEMVERNEERLQQILVGGGARLEELPGLAFAIIIEIGLKAKEAIF